MENGEKRGGSRGPPGTPETPGSPGGTRRLKEYYEQLWSGGDNKTGSSPVPEQKRTGKLCYPDCHPHHPHPTHTSADNTDYQWIKLR